MIYLAHVITCLRLRLVRSHYDQTGENGTIPVTIVCKEEFCFVLLDRRVVVS